MTNSALPQVHLRIGDQHLTTGSGGVHQHVNPSTGQVQAEIPLAGPAEVEAACQAAQAAFQIWRRTPPAARRDALLKLADLMGQARKEIAAAAALENGVAIGLATTQVWLTRQWISYYAGWADKLEGTVSNSMIHGGDFTYTLPEPYGVIAVITTWNVPLLSVAMKIGPALAAGNTVVIKPSEMTPFTPEIFARLADEAGIPAGVINMVPGTAEAGAALVAHPLTQKVSFTGGPATARIIMASCAQHLKPSVMELGGKSANIIFPDANLDVAVHEVVTGGLANLSGQACIMGSRVLLHEDIYDEVISRLKAGAEALAIGDPSVRGNVMGPVVNAAATQRILGLIEEAKANGDGTLLTGGTKMGGDLANGNFIAPTLFVDVDPASSLAMNEVFGPVCAVIKFKTEEEAIAIANSTQFGLAAYIHSNDLNLVHRVSEELRAGSVYVNGAYPVVPNTPFGGLGESGFGREGGKPGIEEFIRPKSVIIAGPRQGVKK